MMRYVCVILLLLLPACVASDAPRDDAGGGGWSIIVGEGGDQSAFSVPPGNVKVEIERYAFERSDREAFGAAVDYRDGDVDLHASGPGVRHGLRVFAAREGLRAGLTASRRGVTYRSRSRGFALLVPGSTAQLDVVELTPRPYVVVIPTYDGGAVTAAGTEQVVTGSSMRVTVHHAGDEAVTLELLPYFHGEQRRGRLMVDQLATTLTVPVGRPVVIMADQQQRQSLATQWLSRTSESRQTEVIAVLTVEVGGGK